MANLESLLNTIKHRKRIVLLMDIFIMVSVSVVLFLLSPLGNGTGDRSLLPLAINLAVWLTSIVAFQSLFRTYDSLWRYAESSEYLRLLLGFFCGTGVYLVLTTVVFERTLSGLYMLSVIGCSVICMLLVRFAYRDYRRNRQTAMTSGDERRQVAIIGAGGAGVALLDELERNPASNYRVWCFFDDDLGKIGHRIHGVEVRGPIDSLPQVLKKSTVYDIILAIPSLSVDRRQSIVKMCGKLQCRLRILPDTLMVMESGNMSYSAALREVRIEDLLGRTSVYFDRSGLESFLHDKIVLVTGAGGSIGSELCRQIAAYQPRQLVLLDAFENNVYMLYSELRRLFPNNRNIVIEIASIRDPQRLEAVLSQYRPQVLLHAAAHKHVPLMEHAPEEAVKNNIFGTYNLMTLAAQNGCRKFVQISTDKAVNPTNVMGATKRFCEMMVRAMDERYPQVDFVAVRFGNVLGSSGSVIPIFREQIANGGPVTVTDRRITRYFMTIPEAASLVLRAGAIANSSETYVLDMGEPVHIWNLAEKMITLSGFQPYQDIDIQEVGLRPGEKLYEELLLDPERHRATSSKKIFVEKQKEHYSMDMLEQVLEDMRQAIAAGDRLRLVELLREAVPTFHVPETESDCNIAEPDLVYRHRTGRPLGDSAHPSCPSMKRAE